MKFVLVRRPSTTAPLDAVVEPWRSVYLPPALRSAIVRRIDASDLAALLVPGGDGFSLERWANASPDADEIRVRLVDGTADDSFRLRRGLFDRMVPGGALAGTVGIVRAAPWWRVVPKPPGDGAEVGCTPDATVLPALRSRWADGRAWVDDAAEQASSGAAWANRRVGGGRPVGLHHAAVVRRYPATLYSCGALFIEWTWTAHDVTGAVCARLVQTGLSQPTIPGVAQAVGGGWGSYIEAAWSPLLLEGHGEFPVPV